MKNDKKKPSEYGLNLFVSDGNGKTPRSWDAVSIGKEIYFDPDILNSYRWDGWEAIHHDLLTLAAAVECADRQKGRRLSKWSRELNIVLPVSEIRLWQSPQIQTSLCEALRHLTGDNWHFEFVESVVAHNCTRQGALPFPRDRVKYTIAYSDGLDSRCVSGLYPTEEIVRVRVAGKKDRAGRGEKPFDLIPFHVKPHRSPENSVRSRGFKFAAITGIASHLSGVSKIIVPESGQGALGPVLLPLHNIYPDYRNHPAFFRKMEKFIEALLGHAIDFEQPRLWATKGQTVQAYLAAGGQEDELVSSRSCWQQRWNARYNGKLRQCGLCAACLLRRMSMHAAGIVEPDDTYTISDLGKAKYSAAIPRSNSLRPSKSMLEYGIVGARHLQHFSDISDLPDDRLKVHAFEIAQSIGATEQETLGKLKDLSAQHAVEWQAFIQSQGDQSFINKWIVGGRHDRS